MTDSTQQESRLVTNPLATRPCIVAGNWKMHKTIAEAKDYVSTLQPLTEGVAAKVYIGVPAIALQASATAAQGTSIVVGAQNMHDADHGAFTGEVSASMLIDAGAQFVILGHSERRHVFGEDDAFVNRKVIAALNAGIQPIFCCGETLEQREGGQMNEVLTRQLEVGLSGVTAEQLKGVIVAYEPVWAIGTGKTASPEQAQEAHQFLREELTKGWGADAANAVVIQYGGSVKPDNAAELLALPDVDGVLVGGAALKADSFAAIAQAYTKTTETNQ